METARACTQDTAIAVAVKKGRHSQLALKWAVENLMKENQSMMLVHFRHKSDTFNRGAVFGSSYEEMVAACGQDVARGLEQGYKDTLNMQAKEMFRPLVSYCKKKNVHCDEVVIEDDDLVQGISDFVFTNNIDILVVGMGSRGGILRLKGPETASKLSKSVPYFCTVYTVAEGGLVSVKSASTATQTPSSSNSVQIQEPEIGIHVQSPNSQMEPRILVSAGEFLLQPSPVKEFEFRSPLKNYGDSDFSWEGHPPADSDISFINNDRQFYDRVSSSLSTNCSNCCHGSFSSKQMSSSTTSPANGQGSFRFSDASYSPQYTMDALRRLQLELMQAKKMYEAACQEALNAKMLASKLKPENLEKDEEMNIVTLSALGLAKLDKDKNKAATKIANIAKRIAELNAHQTC